MALNLPLKKAQTTPDLKFVDHGGTTAKDEGRAAETTSGDLLEASAQVACYDYGAYGGLRVFAMLDDGGVVLGHLPGQAGKDELAIPLDDNNHHVADGWEGDDGKPAEWDGATEPNLDGTPGDGLSFYQRYRGLVHKGAIVRLRSDRKNLVIVNEMGDSAAVGLKLFESASGIHVVELGKGELPEGRVANNNADTGHNGAQCGLRLMNGPLPEGTIGMSLPDRVKTSPRDCDQTVINDNLSFLPAGAFADLLATGIAHELGHSLGAQHHGDSPVGTTYENVIVTDPSVRIFGTDGQPITQRPFALQGLIESKVHGGESSGEQDCVMRNSSYFQWVKRVDNMGVLAYYAVPPTPSGKTFCLGRAGTGINGSGNQPISYFGNAADGRGVCATYLRVNDN